MSTNQHSNPAAHHPQDQPGPSQRIPALEFFCGIGGFAAACSSLPLKITAAFDQNETALQVYRQNFPDHPAFNINLEQANPEFLSGFLADFWWLSPPCQPYTHQGSRRDLDDPRAGSFLRLLEIFPETRRPTHLALENVVGFADSRARDKVVELLDRHRYYVEEEVLCPTELGVPMRRPRYYLTASRQPLKEIDREKTTSHDRVLASYLDQLISDRNLFLTDTTLARFHSGLRILHPEDASAYSTCFTAGYGRKLMHAGSFLQDINGVRHLSPAEIARLFGLGPDYLFPEDLSLRSCWRLLGNSLSVDVVRHLLQKFHLDSSSKSAE